MWFLLFLGLCCFGGWWLLRPKAVNPYIEEHKARQLNDDLYEDYIKWMDKKGHGLPIDKLKRQEEIDFKKDMKDFFGGKG